MTVTDKLFYAQLGQRIAEARKTRGMTQVQLSEALGIAQQTLAHYEGGKLRVAVALLPSLAQILGVGVDELIVTPVRRAGKRGPTPELQQQIERLSILPQVKLDIPVRLAREAQAAGLLTPKGIQQVLKEAMRRRAGEVLIAAAQRAGKAGGDAPDMDELVDEVRAVRAARKRAGKAR